MVARRMVILGFLVVGAAGCGDELSQADSVELTDIADTGDEALRSQWMGFFSATPDQSCGERWCLGYHLRPLNKSLMRCANGKLRPSCYVERLQRRWIDWGELPFISKLPIIVPGHLESRKVFRADDVWLGEGKMTPGTFYALKTNGVVCVDTPCFSLLGREINTPSKKTLFSGLVGNPDLIRQAYRAMADGAPTIVSGTPEVDGDGLNLRLAQVYIDFDPR
jgi:hypothetical protein